MIKPKNTKVTAGAALAVLIVLLFSFASCAEKRDVSRDIPAMAIPAAGLVPPIVPGTPTPAPEPVWINSVQAGDEYQLQAAITNAAAAGPTIIEVMNDIQIVSGLEVPDVCSVKIISGGGNQFIIYGNNHRILYNETIGSDIYLENLVLKGGRAAYGDRDSQGGTINNQNSSLTITRCLIGESSSDQNGGAIYSYGDGASLTIIDSTFVNNRAESSNGGAIYHIGGDLTVTGTTFYNNEGNYYGGAIYASSAGTTTAYFKDCYISHNTAPTGGGLYCTASSSYFIDCTISGNEGKRGFGGGLYLYSDTVLAGDNLTVDNNSARIGAGIYTGRKLTILSGSISDNITGTDYAYGDSDGDGGGVYNEGEFVMFGGAISNNTATDARGGGVVSTGTFTMSGGEIGTNYADTGGGVYNDGYFELASGTIRKNENGNHTGGFDGWGGGVFNGSSGVFLMKGGLIDEHNSYNGNGGGVANIGDFIMSGGEISHNFADHGGGVSTGDMTKHVNGVTKGSFTMQGGLIADNEALSEGGIQNQGGSCVISGGDITRNLTVMGFGGGIGSSNGDLTITGGTISYNEADNGAGIEINTGDLTITGGTIEHNTAIGEGGGILASNGTFIMAGGKIINNKAYAGGGIMNGMDFKFSAGEVSGNTADSGGGGIFMYMPMSITGTAKIMNNNATIGGGLYRYGHAAYPGGSVITDDAQISGNTAQKSGGGIYVVGDAISLAGSAKVSNNKAASGGGIFEDSNGKLFISEKAEISGNEASANGGGIACAYVTHMSGGSVSGNKAVKLGGGVYSSGELTLSGGAISGNSVSDVAGLSGGGGIANAGRLMISGGEISSNSALDSGYGGGGVLNKGEGSVRASFTFDGGVISGNKAYVGGGVTNYNRNTFTMLNGTVSGNTANYNGGGLYNSTDADFSMSGGAFLKNTATQDSGGAIYQSGANAMPISGDIRFSGNRAGEDGGAIWVSQSNRSSVTVSDRVEFSKNRAKTGYELDPADLVEYNTFVGATVFSWGMTYGWNNHDISYTSGTEVPFVEPPDGEHAAYVSGYPDGTIRPNSGVTRAEAATMFYRLISAGFELTLPGGGKAEFSDVAPEQWYYGFITPLAEMTLLSGYPDGSFRPDQPITRAEFAAIAARIASLSGVQAVRPPLEFSDVNENDWYSSALDTATAVGWLAGDGDIFRPQDGLTRAEFMASANNMTGRLPHTKEDIVMPPADGLRTWPDNADTSSWYYLAVQEATNSHEYVRTEDRGGAQYDYERWLGLK